MVSFFRGSRSEDGCFALADTPFALKNAAAVVSGLTESRPKFERPPDVFAALVHLLGDLMRIGGRKPGSSGATLIRVAVEP